MATPKDLIKKYRIRPLKRLGQSFLIDGNVIEKIVRTAGLRGEDTVVEIGAGLGVMTSLIARQAGRVVALEIDRQMIPILEEELKGLPNIEIVEADVLRYDFSLLSESREAAPGFKVIGNIPYHISSPILFHLLESRNHIGVMVLMLQKEVADRLAASPGSKAYGTLSVILSMYFAISREFIVPARCFYPPPKVDSAVIKMAARAAPLVPLEDEEFFRRLVRISFGQRRKTLLNNLKGSLDLKSFSERDILAALGGAGIDGRRRGETLTVEEFGRLSNSLVSLQIP